MPDHFELLYRLFSDLGFQVTRSKRFESFGDYVIEACSAYFCLKGVSDKGVESIEWASLQEPDSWFDSDVIMSYVLSTPISSGESELETQLKFLETHLDDLIRIFDSGNYENTRKGLHDLELQRAHRRFPRWFP